MFLLSLMIYIYLHVLTYLHIYFPSHSFFTPIFLLIPQKSSNIIVCLFLFTTFPATILPPTVPSSTIPSETPSVYPPTFLLFTLKHLLHVPFDNSSFSLRQRLRQSSDSTFFYPPIVCPSFFSDSASINPPIVPRVSHFYVFWCEL